MAGIILLFSATDDISSSLFNTPKQLHLLYWHFLTFPKYWKQKILDSNFLPQPQDGEKISSNIV